MTSRCRVDLTGILLSLLSLILLPAGCQRAGDPVPLDAALELQETGHSDQAIQMLAREDIEKNLHASSLRTLKINENEFKELPQWKRDFFSEESLLLVPLLKRAAYLQIEQLQAAEDAGAAEKEKALQSQLQRLIGFLQDKQRLQLYQQLGGGIQMKLKEATSDQVDSSQEST
ncbi:hypothetical protein [Gimesia chilikensis]|uniref:Uncharacterized protein n=1 Tax=Gimesia chilikensis TaxID=2605989 RepID=A0A517PYK1_9PLAN|nr:hypothetical protein [Gimesia chilikensis]QDT24458.1 hypothetical protein HG66A1_62900 [Gimesia chilikensis]